MPEPSLASTSQDQQIEWRVKSWQYKLLTLGIWLILLFIVLLCALTLRVRWDRMGTLITVFNTIARFWPPDLGIWRELLNPALETILMAFLGTAIGMFLSLPVIIMAAKNINLPLKHLLYTLGRIIIVFSRSVHELIWALIFVTALGLGAFPGVLALSVRSVGFISKMMAESIENINENQVEAIMATGANSFQVWVFGIIPQIIPTLIAVLIFRWDVNLRASTILGVVGAGGIGYMLDISMKTFTYSRATTIIIVIVALVAMGELISNKMREKYVKEETGGR